MKNEPITISLSHSEALVLFEWLAGLEERKIKCFADSSEELVAWKIEGILEKILIEPLQPNYRQLIAMAKRDVSNAGCDSSTGV
jgi:hypothetical protein